MNGDVAWKTHVLNSWRASLNVVVHGTNQFPCSITLFQVDANMLVWFHFKFDWVFGFNGFSQVLYIIFINILGPNLRNTKAWCSVN